MARVNDAIPTLIGALLIALAQLQHLITSGKDIHIHPH